MLFKQKTIFCFVQAPAKLSWDSAVEALKDALKKEAEVTKSIRKVIAVCSDDGFNDYHVSNISFIYLSIL